MSKNSRIFQLQSEYEAFLFAQQKAFENEAADRAQSLADEAQVLLERRMAELNEELYTQALRHAAEQYTLREEYGGVLLQQQKLLVELQEMLAATSYDMPAESYMVSDISREQQALSALQAQSTMKAQENRVLRERQCGGNENADELAAELKNAQEYLAQRMRLRDQLVHQCEIMGEEVAARGRFMQAQCETKTAAFASLKGAQ